MDTNEFFTNDQFGFRPGRSTEDQLLLTYNDVFKWLDQGLTVDLTLFVFSKASDVVCHDILITKLYSLGIRGRVLDWINSFLHNRMMKVVVDRQYSDPHEVKSGVPQGSVLGPLLFLIYINFLTHNINSLTKIYADDLKLYISISLDTPQNILDSVTACQLDINTLADVAKSWGLSMNPNKCVLLRFGGATIPWEQLSFFWPVLFERFFHSTKKFCL